MPVGLPSNLFNKPILKAGGLPSRFGKGALRAGATVAKEPADERSVDELASELPEQAPGFLYSLGRGADYLGRGVRGAILGHGWDPNGEGDVSGWDVLDAMGAGKKGANIGEYSGLWEGFVRPGGSGWNPANWDWMDLAAFGVEVVTDPITYALGGLGHIGKTTRMAHRVEAMEAKALQHVTVGVSIKAAAAAEIKRAADIAAKRIPSGILGPARKGQPGYQAALERAGVESLELAQKGHIRGIAPSQIAHSVNATANDMTRKGVAGLLKARKLRDELTKAGHGSRLSRAPDLKKAIAGEYRGTFPHIERTIEDMLSGSLRSRTKDSRYLYDASEEAIERMGYGSWVERLWHASSEGAKSGKGRLKGMWDEISGATGRHWIREKEAFAGVVSGETRGNSFLTLGLPQMGGPITHGIGRTGGRLIRLLTRPLAGKQVGLSKYGPKIGRDAQRLKGLRLQLQSQGVEVGIAATIDDILEGYVTGRLGGGNWFGSTLTLLKKDFVPEVNIIKTLLADGITGKPIGAVLEHILLRSFRIPVRVAKEAIETTQLPRLWRRHFKTGLKNSPQVQGMREAMELAVNRGIIDANDLANVFENHIARLASEPAVKAMIAKEFGEQAGREIEEYLAGTGTELGEDAGLALQDLLNHFDDPEGMSPLIEAQGEEILSRSALSGAVHEEIPENMARYLFQGIEESGGVAPGKFLNSADELADPASKLVFDGDTPVGILIDSNGQVLEAGAIRSFGSAETRQAINKLTGLLEEAKESLKVGKELIEHRARGEANFGPSGGRPNSELLDMWDKISDIEKLEILRERFPNELMRGALVTDDTLAHLKNLTLVHESVGEDVLRLSGKESAEEIAERVVAGAAEQNPAYRKPGIGTIQATSERGRETLLTDPKFKLAEGEKVKQLTAEPIALKKPQIRQPATVEVGKKVYVKKEYNSEGVAYPKRKVQVLKEDPKTGEIRTHEIDLPYYEEKLIKSEHPFGNTKAGKAKANSIMQRLYHIATAHGNLEETTGIPGISNFDTFRDHAQNWVRDWANVSGSDLWKAFYKNNPEMASKVRQLWWEPMFWNPQSRYFAGFLRRQLQDMSRIESMAGLKRFYDPAHLQEVAMGRSSFLADDHPLFKLNMKEKTNTQGKIEYWYEHKLTQEEVDIMVQQRKVQPDQAARWVGSIVERPLPVPQFEDAFKKGVLDEDAALEFARLHGFLDENMFPVDNFVDGVAFYYPRILSDDARAFLSDHPELFEDLVKGIKASFKGSTVDGRFMHSRKITEHLTSDIKLVNVLKEFNGATKEFFDKVIAHSDAYGPTGTYKGKKLPKSIMDGTLFENDPVKALILRQLASNTATNHAYFLQSAIHMFAKPVGSRFHGPGVKVLDALDRQGAHFNWAGKSGLARQTTGNIPQKEIMQTGPSGASIDVENLNAETLADDISGAEEGTTIKELWASLFNKEAQQGTTFSGLPGAKGTVHEDFTGFENVVKGLDEPPVYEVVIDGVRRRVVSEEVAEQLVKSDSSAVRNVGTREADRLRPGQNPWDMGETIEAIQNASVKGRPRPRIFEGHMVRDVAADTAESRIGWQGKSPIEYPHWHPLKQIAYEMYYGRQLAEQGAEQFDELGILQALEQGAKSGEFKFTVPVEGAKNGRDFHFAFAPKMEGDVALTGKGRAYRTNQLAEDFLRPIKKANEDIADLGRADTDPLASGVEHSFVDDTAQRGGQLSDRMDQGLEPPGGEKRGWPSLRTEADTVEGAFTHHYRKFFKGLESLDDAGRKKLRDEGLSSPRGEKLIPSVKEFGDVSKHHKTFYDLKIQPAVAKGFISEEAAAFLRLFFKDFGIEQVKYMSSGEGSLLVKLLPEDSNLWGRTDVIRKSVGAQDMSDMLTRAARGEKDFSPPIQTHGQTLELHPRLKETPIAHQVLVMTHEIGHNLSRNWSKNHQQVWKHFTATANLNYQKGNLKEMIRNYIQIPGRGINTPNVGVEFEKWLDNYTNAVLKSKDGPEELFAILFSHSVMRRKIPAALAESMGASGIDVLVNVQRGFVSRLKHINKEFWRHVKNDWPAELKARAGHFENTEKTRQLKDNWYRLRRMWEDIDMGRIAMEKDDMLPLFTKGDKSLLGKLEEQMARIEQKLSRHTKEKFGLYGEDAKAGKGGSLDDIRITTPEHTDEELLTGLGQHGLHMVKYIDAVTDWVAGMGNSQEELLKRVIKMRNRSFFNNLFGKDLTEKQIRTVLATSNVAKVLENRWGEVHVMDSKLDVLERRLYEMRDEVANQMGGSGVKESALQEAHKAIIDRIQIVKGRIQNRKAFDRTLDDLWDGDTDPMKIMYENSRNKGELFLKEAPGEEALRPERAVAEALEQHKTGEMPVSSDLGEDSLELLEKFAAGEQLGKRSGEEIFPSGVIQGQDFKKLVDYTDQFLGKHADTLDEFEEILISSRAPNQRVVNSFRHHNVHYEDRIAVGLDDYDVGMWMKYMEADIAFQRFGANGLNDLSPQAWGGWPADMNMDNIANTRAYFLSIFDMLHGNDTLGKNILNKVNYRRAVETPEVFMQEMMPDLIKESGKSFTDLVPENFWNYFQWLKKHKRPGSKLPTLDEWLQGQVRNDQMFFEEIIMDLNRTRMDVFSRNDHPYAALEHRLAQETHFPTVKDPQHLKWRHLPDEQKLKLMDEYLMDNGINPHFVKSFILSRFNDPRWKIMGGNFVPKQRYTKFGNGEVYAVKEMTDVLGSLGEDVKTMIAPAQAATMTEQMLGAHDQHYRTIMAWIDETRNISRETSEALQTAPVGTKRSIGWDDPMISGVASKEGKILSLSDAGNIDLNDPIAKMSGPTGVLVDPIGSRLHPYPYLGKGQPLYGKTFNIADDYAGTSQFQEILERDVMNLNEEIKDLKRVLFNKKAESKSYSAKDQVRDINKIDDLMEDIKELDYFDAIPGDLQMIRSGGETGIETVILQAAREQGYRTGGIASGWGDRSFRIENPNVPHQPLAGASLNTDNVMFDPETVGRELGLESHPTRFRRSRVMTGRGPGAKSNFMTPMTREQSTYFNIVESDGTILILPGTAKKKVLPNLTHENSASHLAYKLLTGKSEPGALAKSLQGYEKVPSLMGKAGKDNPYLIIYLDDVQADNVKLMREFMANKPVINFVGPRKSSLDSLKKTLKNNPKEGEQFGLKGDKRGFAIPREQPGQRPSSVTRIISGGQIGADQVGMQVATDIGIPTAGMAPPGWATSKGPMKDAMLKWGMTEGLPDPKIYRNRTIANVRQAARDGGGTVIFFATQAKKGKRVKVPSRGSFLTQDEAIRAAEQFGTAPPIINPSAQRLREWIDRHQITTLNIAGSRKVNQGVLRKVLYEALGGKPAAVEGFQFGGKEYIVHMPAANQFKAGTFKFSVDPKTERIIEADPIFQRFVSNKNKLKDITEWLNMKGAKIEEAGAEAAVDPLETLRTQYRATKDPLERLRIRWKATKDPAERKALEVEAKQLEEGKVLDPEEGYGVQPSDEAIAAQEKKQGYKFVGGKADKPKPLSYNEIFARDNPNAVLTGVSRSDAENAAMNAAQRETLLRASDTSYMTWLNKQPVAKRVELKSLKPVPRHGERIIDQSLMDDIAEAEKRLGKHWDDFTDEEMMSVIHEPRQGRGFAQERQAEFQFGDRIDPEDIPPRPEFIPVRQPGRAYDPYEHPKDVLQREREWKKANREALKKFQKEEAEWLALYGNIDARGFAIKNNLQSVKDPYAQAQDLAEALFRGDTVPYYLTHQLSTLQKVVLGAESGGTFKESLRQFYLQLDSEFHNPAVRNTWAKWKIRSHKILDRLFEQWKGDENILGHVPKLPNWSIAEEVQVARMLSNVDPDQFISPVGMGGRPRPELAESIEEFAAGTTRGRLPGAFKPEVPVSIDGGELFVPDFSDARRVASRILQHPDGVPFTMEEIDELVTIVGKYEFAHHIGKKLADWHAPKRPMRIPIGGLQAKMERMLNPENLAGFSGGGLQYGKGHITPQMMKEAQSPWGSPHLWEGLGMEHPLPARLPARDEEAWWAASHGFMSVRDMPSSHLVSPMKSGDVGRWDKIFRKYKDQILDSAGIEKGKYRPDELESLYKRTVEDFIRNRQHHRVDPFRSELFTPGSIEGPGSMFGRKPLRHKSGSDLSAPGLRTGRYYDTYKKLVQNERYRERNPWDDKDWVTDQDKEYQHYVQRYIAHVYNWDDGAVSQFLGREGSYAYKAPGDLAPYEYIPSGSRTARKPKGTDYRITHVAGFPYGSAFGLQGGLGAGAGKGGGKRIFLPIGALNDPGLLRSAGWDIDPAKIMSLGKEGPVPNFTHVHNINPQLSHYHNDVGARGKAEMEMGRWKYVWDPDSPNPATSSDPNPKSGRFIKAFHLDPATKKPTRLASGELARKPPQHPLERVEPMPKAFGPIAVAPGGHVPGIAAGGTGIARAEDLAMLDQWLQKYLAQLPHGQYKRGMPSFAEYLQREIWNHRLFPELSANFKWVHNRHRNMLPPDFMGKQGRVPRKLSPEQIERLKAQEFSERPGTPVPYSISEETGRLTSPKSQIVTGEAGDIGGGEATFMGATESPIDVSRNIEMGTNVPRMEISKAFSGTDDVFNKTLSQAKREQLERASGGVIPDKGPMEMGSPAQLEATASLMLSRKDNMDRLVEELNAVLSGEKKVFHSKDLILSKGSSDALEEVVRIGKETIERGAGPADPDTKLKIRAILGLIEESGGDVTRKGRTLEWGMPEEATHEWEELFQSDLIPASELDAWADEVMVSIGGGKGRRGIKVKRQSDEMIEEYNRRADERGPAGGPDDDIEDFLETDAQGRTLFYRELIEDASERQRMGHESNRSRFEEKSEFVRGERPNHDRILQSGMIDEVGQNNPYLIDVGGEGGRWIRRQEPLAVDEKQIGTFKAGGLGEMPTQYKEAIPSHIKQGIGKSAGQPSHLPLDAEEEYLIGLARKLDGAGEGPMKHKWQAELETRLQHLHEPESRLHNARDSVGSRGATTQYEMRTWPSDEEFRHLHQSADMRSFSQLVDEVDKMRNQTNRKPWYKIGDDPAAVGRGGTELDRVLGDVMFGNDIQPFMTKGIHGLQGLEGDAATAAKQGWWHEDVSTVPLSKFLSESDLNSFMHPETRQLVQVSDNLVEMKQILKHYGLDKYGIPTEIYNDIMRASENVMNRPRVNNFFKKWGQMNALVKGALTQLYPAFYFRNIFSDFMLSFMSNGFDAAVFGDAANIAFGRDAPLKSINQIILRKGVGKGGATTVDVEKLLQSSKVFQGTKYAQFVEDLAGSSYDSEFNQLVKKLVSGKTASQSEQAAAKSGKILPGNKESIFNKLAVFKWLFESSVPKKFTKIVKKWPLRRISQVGERFTRASHFLARMRAGDDAMSAITHTRTHLLDYSDLTAFEKQYMQNTILFYSWSRKIIPRLYENFFANPGKTAMILRGTVNPSIERDDILPEWIRRSAAIPVGDEGYVYGLGSPFEELNKFDWTSPTESAPKNMDQLLAAAGRILKKGVVQTNPIIKGAVELATGQDLFKGQAWQGMDRLGPEWWILQKLGFPVEEQVLPGGTVRHRMPAGYNFLSRTAPIGRLVKEAGTVSDVVSGMFGTGDIDPNRSGWESLVKFGTGFKYAPKGEREELWAKEQYLQKLLEGFEHQGLAGEIPIYFPIGGGKDIPDIKFMIDLLKKIGREKKLLSEQRAGMMYD